MKQLKPFYDGFNCLRTNRIQMKTKKNLTEKKETEDKQPKGAKPEEATSAKDAKKVKVTKK